MPRPTRVVLFAAIGAVAASSCGSSRLPAASAPATPATFYEADTPSTLSGGTASPSSSAGVVATTGSAASPTAAPTGSGETTPTTEAPPQVRPPVASSIPGTSTGNGTDSDPRFPYATLYDVPQLGADPVRGSGCGLAQGLGNDMPDGLWYGLVYPGSTGDTIGFDVACAYYGESALAEGAAPGLQELLYPVNGSDRVRQIERAGDFAFRQAVAGDGGCADPGPSSNRVEVPAGVASWVVVEGGSASLAVAFCS